MCVCMCVSVCVYVLVECSCLNELLLICVPACTCVCDQCNLVKYVAAPDVIQKKKKELGWYTKITTSGKISAGKIEDYTVRHISCWMAKNFLQLNNSKCEIILFKVCPHYCLGSFSDHYQTHYQKFKSGDSDSHLPSLSIKSASHAFSTYELSPR